MFAIGFGVQDVEEFKAFLGCTERLNVHYVVSGLFQDL